MRDCKTCPVCKHTDTEVPFSCGAHYCRECNKRYLAAYRDTPEGMAVRWWSDIKRRAENADGRHPSYAHVSVVFTRAEFLSWAVPAIKIFKTVHSYERPSIDRIDPDGNYALGNVRVISWRDNSRLARRKTAKRVKSHLGLPWVPSPSDRRTDTAFLSEVSPSWLTRQARQAGVPNTHKPDSLGAPLLGTRDLL